MAVHRLGDVGYNTGVNYPLGETWKMDRWNVLKTVLVYQAVVYLLVASTVFIGLPLNASAAE